MLGVVFIGMIGSLTELLLIGHDEDGWQMIPIVLLGTGILVAGFALARPGPSSLRLLQLVMLAFIAAGGLGAILHYRANVEFQREMEPNLAGTALVWTVLQAKSPPALSPGLMVQLGLLGLIYTWGHPATKKGDRT